MKSLFIQCKKCYTKKLAEDCNKRTRICYECIYKDLEKKTKPKKVKPDIKKEKSKSKTNYRNQPNLRMPYRTKPPTDKWPIYPMTGYCYACNEWFWSVDTICHVKSHEHKKKIIENLSKY